MTKQKLYNFTTLTFDVVGTLIDFEAGILSWFSSNLAERNIKKTEDEILTSFAISEDKYQKETPDQPFTAMLTLIYKDMMLRWGFEPNNKDALEFRESIKTWPAFNDAIAALKALKSKYKLVAVTNADSWALKHMSNTLENPFDEQVTCDEVGVNKPSQHVFNYVLKKLAPLGVKKEHILHTAQSQYHDIIPAMEIGLSTMWIERRHGKNNFGATPKPLKITTPTYHACSMDDFVHQVYTQDV